MSYPFPLHVPVAPMMGDPIIFEGTTVVVSGEFARLNVALDRFAVEAADGFVYEVEVFVRGDGRRGSQQWAATRRIAKADFKPLARNEAP